MKFNFKPYYQQILEKVSVLNIFQFYLHDLPFKYNIKSPLRKDDDTPSFRLLAINNDVILFKDFGGKKGNVFEFVKLLYGVDYITACKIIDKDMKLGIFEKTNNVIDYPKIELQNFNLLKNKQKLKIKIKSIDFTEKDLEWWLEYGITLNTLNKFKVKRISHYFLGYDTLYLTECKETTYVISTTYFISISSFFTFC